jgi:hypothetical protein
VSQQRRLTPPAPDALQSTAERGRWAAQANTGWPLQPAPDISIIEPPSAAELRLLREELDRQGIYLKG